MLKNEAGEIEIMADGVVLGHPSRPCGPIEVILGHTSKYEMKYIKLRFGTCGRRGRGGWVAIFLRKN